VARAPGTPLDAVCPPAASHGVLVLVLGWGWPLWGFGAAWGEGGVFQAHLHPLPQIDLRSPPAPRADTQSKINAARKLTSSEEPVLLYISDRSERRACCIFGGA
jgi:hypothetical protein